MTKYEIEIDLPADVLAKYEPVEVRIKNAVGEMYWDGREVCTWGWDSPSLYPSIILRPKATWDEWPVWLTKATCIVRGPEGHWMAHTIPPLPTDYGWKFQGGHHWALQVIAMFTNLTLPEYDGPWEHSLIRNPHLSKAESVTADKVEESKPVASEQKTDRREWWIIEPDNVGAEAYPCEQCGMDGEPAQPQSHAREVLPGDPDPDAAKRLMETVERYMGSNGPPSYYYDVLSALAAAKGGQ